METFEVDGKQARLHRQGSGTPLVYLHSGFGEVGALPIFAELERAGFGVLAPEMPGFGTSEPVVEWHRIEDAVFHLRRTLDVLEIDRAVLVGSSLGGWLAAELAVWFPERVDTLVLVDAVGLHIDDAPVFELFGARPDELVRRVFPHGGDLLTLIGPALADPTDGQAVMLHFFHAMEAMARIGWTPYLHDPKLPSRLPVVAAPTLVLWGADDGVVPLAHGEAYASGIRDARLEVLDACGHLPVLEKPADVADRVAAFAATSVATP